MTVIKKLSKKTWIGEDKKEHRYVNYYLELDNKKRIAIKTVRASDLKVLEGVAIYERNE